jgi:hypothetical protein
MHALILLHVYLVMKCHVLLAMVVTYVNLVLSMMANGIPGHKQVGALSVSIRILTRSV